MFSSLWPQSYPSQGRGQIFCTRLLLYLGIRGLRKCDPSHTFRPSNMKRNIGDPYRSSGPWGAGNPAVRGDFAIALINLMPDPTSGCQPGPPSFGDPLLGGLLGSIFPDSCGPGPKMTILDLLGPIFFDSAAKAPKRRFWTSWGPFSPILLPRSKNDDFGPPGVHFRSFCGPGPKTSFLELLIYINVIKKDTTRGS